MNVSVRFIPLLILAIAGSPAVPQSFAQTSVTTNPVGYNQLTCTGTADTIVSVPFNQPASFVGTVAAISGSTVTVTGTTGWTANQYVYSGSGTSTYYAQMGPYSSGTDPLDGSYYTVASNGTNTLTLFLNGGNISTVPSGSTVTVYPYWTLGTVFPASTSGTAFIASGSPGARQTQILLPNYSATGINNASSTTYYFYNGAWRLVGDSPSNSHNDDILIPDGYMTVRNPATTGTSTVLTAMGSVPTGNLIIPLSTNVSGDQDNPVSIERPVSTTLNNLGLIASGAFTTSATPGARQDELLVTGTNQVGTNVAPNETYYYLLGTSGTGWRLVGDAVTNDHGNDVIPSGSGFIVRKVPTNNGVTAFWQNPPTY